MKSARLEGLLLLLTGQREGRSAATTTRLLRLVQIRRDRNGNTCVFKRLGAKPGGTARNFRCADPAATWFHWKQATGKSLA
jgi:hypothetical protein